MISATMAAMSQVQSTVKGKASTVHLSCPMDTEYTLSEFTLLAWKFKVIVFKTQYFHFVIVPYLYFSYLCLFRKEKVT